MTNFLKEFQFREPSSDLPNWDDEEYFSDWQDIEDSSGIFNSRTQFRLKPKYVYSVATKDMPKSEQFKSFQEMTERVNVLVEEGHIVTIEKAELTTGGVIDYMLSNNIQFKESNKGMWRNATYFSPSGHSNILTFRTRPDYYYNISTNNDVITGEITFDDIEDAAVYVNSRVRTEGMSFSFQRVKYV